jgi:hypothetical protein
MSQNNKLPSPFDLVPSGLWEVLFTNLPVGLCIIDPDKNILTANERFAAIVERPSSFLTGQSLRPLVGRNSVDQTMLLVDSVFAGVLSGSRQLIALETQDHEDVWVEIGIQGVSGPDGNIVCVLINALPIKTSPLSRIEVSSFGWFRANWSKLIPVFLALSTFIGSAIAASYHFYAEWRQTVQHLKELQAEQDALHPKDKDGPSYKNLKE